MTVVAIERLIASALDGAEVLKITALKSDSVDASVTAKDVRYGVPLRIDVRHEAPESSMLVPFEGKTSCLCAGPVSSTCSSNMRRVARTRGLASGTWLTHLVRVWRKPCAAQYRVRQIAGNPRARLLLREGWNRPGRRPIDSLRMGATLWT